MSAAGPAAQGQRTVLVLPCFNEERRLPVDELRAALDALPDLDLVLVDDGSTDGTRARLGEVRAGRERRVEVLALDANGGKGEAVRAGMLRALGRRPLHAGYWDADLATPLCAVADLRAVLDARPGIEIVTGARIQLLGRDIRRRAARHYAGRVFATAVSTLLGVGVYDTQCGAKLFRVVPHLPALFEAPFVSRWVFDVEILARRLELGRARGLPPLEAVVHEHPLERWHDVGGSKLRPADFLRSALDLERIRRRYDL